LAGLGGLLFGYDSSDIAIALPFIERIFPSVAASTALKEAVVSVTTLGAAFGAFSGGFLSDAFGRRSAILLCDVIFLIAALKMGVAATPSALIRGRALMGVAIGLTSIVGPVYIAESSPSSIRATLVVLYSIQIGIGTSLAYVLDFGFTHTRQSWRFMLSAAAVPAVVQLIGISFMPESPRWLASSGRVAEAKAVAASLSVDPSDSERDCADLDRVHANAEALKTEAGAQAARVRNWQEVGTQFALGCSCFLLNNFSGESALVYYSISIVSMAGVVSEASIAQALIDIGISASAGVLLGFLMIDRLGRRRLLAISGAGTSASLFLLAFSFALAQRRSPSALPLSAESLSLDAACSAPASTCRQCIQSACSFCGVAYEGPGQPQPGVCLARDGPTAAAREACASLGQALLRGNASFASSSGKGYSLYRQGCPSGVGWLSLLALCSFQFWFQLGLGVVPSALNAELYPSQVRGFCNGSAVAISWLGNFLVSSTFLSLAASLGAARTFCINATLVACGSIALSFYLPETCGLSFAEIQALFRLYHQPGAPRPWALREAILARREEGADQDEGEEEGGFAAAVGH